jgi:hypothetical protein
MCSLASAHAHHRPAYSTDAVVWQQSLRVHRTDSMHVDAIMFALHGESQAGRAQKSKKLIF